MTSIYIKTKPLTFGWLFLKLPHFYTSTRYLKKKKLKTLPSPFLPKTKPESHSLSLSFVSQRKTWEKNIVGLQLLLKKIYIYIYMYINIDMSTYNRHMDCAKKKKKCSGHTIRRIFFTLHLVFKSHLFSLSRHQLQWQRPATENWTWSWPIDAYCVAFTDCNGSHFLFLWWLVAVVLFFILTSR